MWTTVTQSTPTRMTRTITARMTCTSEHSSAPCVVFPVFITCHTTLAQVVHVSVFSSSHVRFSLILFDLSFYFHLHFTVLVLFSFLMHPDQHPDLDTVEHNLRLSAKGSSGAYDVTFSLTGTCNNSFVKSGTLQNACSTRPRVVVGLERSAHSHIVRLMNSRRKGLKRIMTKVLWLC